MAHIGPRMEENRRRELSWAFQEGAEHYDRVRPGYPARAVDRLIPADARNAVDVGAGTGKLTQRLVERGLCVTAVDPSATMLGELQRKLPGVRTVAGTAEDTGEESASTDVVTVAQAWHWFDPLAASSEAARILRPGGTLVLLWNQLNTSVPWVHRFSRIIHAGDVLKPDFLPRTGPEFSRPERDVTPWELATTPENLMGLAQSRSFYLAAGPQARNRLHANLTWYLFEHLGCQTGQPIQLPYVTFGFQAALI